MGKKSSLNHADYVRIITKRRSELKELDALSVAEPVDEDWPQLNDEYDFAGASASLEEIKSTCKQQIGACFDEISKLLYFDDDLTISVFDQFLSERKRRSRSKNKNYVKPDRELLLLWDEVERQGGTKQGLAKYLAENERETYAPTSKPDAAQEAIVWRLGQEIKKRAKWEIQWYGPEKTLEQIGRSSTLTDTV